MKLILKTTALLLLAVLASPVFILNGCGGATGACKDTAAPSGWSIEPAAGILDPPSTSGSCYPHVVFTVTDDTGQPQNDICVELYTDGASVMAKEPEGEVTPCLAVATRPLNSLITRTDGFGHITLELITPPCASSGPVTFFVHASSGAAAGTWKASLDCP